MEMAVIEFKRVYKARHEGREKSKQNEYHQSMHDGHGVHDAFKAHWKKK